MIQTFKMETAMKNNIPIEFNVCESLRNNLENS